MSVLGFDHPIGSRDLLHRRHMSDVDTLRHPIADDVREVLRIGCDTACNERSSAILAIRGKGSGLSDDGAS